MKIKTFFWGLFLCFELLSAHNINQITYKIDLDSTQTMVVHLTQQGAIDLLVSLHPELRNETIFNPKKHVSEYEEYFNQNFVIYADGQVIKLKHIAENFLTHDATITFELVTQIENPDVITLEESAF